jgi:Mn-dependent DtxR family transcriptional regulator
MSNFNISPEEEVLLAMSERQIEFLTVVYVSEKKGKPVNNNGLIKTYKRRPRLEGIVKHMQTLGYVEKDGDTYKCTEEGAAIIKESAMAWL